MGFFWTIVVLLVALALCWRYLGSYMVAVYEGRVHYLGFIERPIYRLLGTSPEKEQTWKRYAGSLVVFSGLSIGLTYALLRLQGSLPLNPQHFGAVPPALSWNTATSFVTNTNWQNYGGEETMSYLSQMLALTVQQFVTPAVGICVALGVIRGFSRKGSPTIGNFWVDTVRGMLYVLTPIAIVAGLIFVGQGAIDTLNGPVHIHNVLNGVSQTIALGPVGFMEAIKQLGTNGGGFFNVNSAHPFENPTGLTNLLSIILLLSIPVALTYVFGKMVGAVRQGVAVLAAMTIIFGCWVGFAVAAEHQPNPAVQAAGLVHQPTGNTVGKETRFGVPSSALFGVASTQTSTGSADSAYDSFTPIGGGALLTGMMIGEVTPGGVGQWDVHHLDLRHHRRLPGRAHGGPNAGVSREEDSGHGGEAGRPGHPCHADHRPGAHRDSRVAPCRKGGSRERRAARVHRDPLCPHLTGQQQRVGVRRIDRRHHVLQRARWDRHVDRPLRDHDPGPRPGRRARRQEPVPAGAGTFRTDNPMFIGLLIGVILIVGGLTFFPAVSLGPIVEQFSHGKFF